MRILPDKPELADLAKQVEQAIRGPADTSIKLLGIATASLPPVAEHPRGIVYDLTTDKPKYSNGTSWVTWPTTAVDLAFTPSGNIAATNVKTAIEELDSEKARLGGTNTFTGVQRMPSGQFDGARTSYTTAHVAISYESSSGQIISYQDGTGHLPLNLQFSTLELRPGGTNVATWDSTGLNMVTAKTIRVNSVQVLTGRQTGWSAATGTATRTSFATSTVTLEQLAQRVKALLDDLITHGVIGT